MYRDEVFNDAITASYLAKLETGQTSNWVILRIIETDNLLGRGNVKTTCISLDKHKPKCVKFSGVF